MYKYILIWGDSILQIKPNGGNDLMYIIPGEEQTALTLWYRRGG